MKQAGNSGLCPHSASAPSSRPASTPCLAEVKFLLETIKSRPAETQGWLHGTRHCVLLKNKGKTQNLPGVRCLSAPAPPYKHCVWLQKQAKPRENSVFRSIPNEGRNPGSNGRHLSSVQSKMKGAPRADLGFNGRPPSCIKFKMKG